MTGDHHIYIHLDLYDAAALPSVLQHRRDEVERTLRLRVDVLSPDAVADLRRFVGQIERARAAIEAALPCPPRRGAIPHPIPPAVGPANLET